MDNEQFYQMMTRLKRSRTASTQKGANANARVTEMVNGVLVSKPAKKIEYISEPKPTTTNEPKVWSLTKDGPLLQQESKAASVPGINKMKAIHDFIRSNGRICMHFNSNPAKEGHGGHP